MNDHTISLVKESFDLVEPIAPQAAALFYANLFQADPSLQRLFRGDMVAQGDRLMQMIGVAVAKLDEPEVLMPALRQLGAPSFGVSLLTPDLDLAAPQLTSADLPPGEPLWRGLCAMQDSGIFGLRGALRSEFAFNDDYPLATLAIESDVLDEKWARTHPDLVATDEDTA